LAGIAGIKQNPLDLLRKSLDLRVLLVNHRAFLRRVQAEMLANSGIVYIEHRTGGIAAVEAPPPDIDLIMCGYDMPQGDGLWLLKKIRLAETAYRPDVPFIFVTDAAERWLISSAKNLDADGYILLPASRQKIDEVVQLAMRRARPVADIEPYEQTPIEPPPEPRRGQSPIAESGMTEGSADEPVTPAVADCFGQVRAGATLLPLHELVPDMVLGASLLSDKGAVLLPEGTLLDVNSVGRLREVSDAFGFDHVPIMAR